MSDIKLKPYNQRFARKCFLEIMNNDKTSWNVYARNYVDKELSVTLYDGNKPIGIYVLGRNDPFEFLNDEGMEGHRVKFEKDLSKYKNKRGIQGILLYVKPEYRNQKLGKILLDYAAQNGDFTWGGHSVHLNNLNHWLKRRNLGAKIYEKNKNNRYQLISYYTFSNLL